MSCRHRWLAWGMDRVSRCITCGITQPEFLATRSAKSEPSSDVWEASSRLRKAAQAEGVPSATRARLQELAAEAEFIAGALVIAEGGDDA